MSVPSADIATPRPLASYPPPLRWWFSTDESLTNWIQAHRSKSGDRLAQLVKPLGDGRTWILPLAFFALEGFGMHEAGERRVFWLMLASFALTGLLQQTIQYFTHRHRPNAGDGPACFDGFSLSPDNRCFPSGHSSVSASMLTLMAWQYGWLPGVVPVTIVLIVVTAWSRLNDHAHWPSDVLTGTLIGVGVTWWLANSSLVPF